MLNIRFSKDSDRFLRRLPSKQRKQLVKKSLSLLLDPFPPDSKTLKGFSGFRGTDFGEYRIIYEILAPILYITLIGKRNDDEVYRKLKRMQ